MMSNLIFAILPLVLVYHVLRFMRTIGWLGNAIIGTIIIAGLIHPYIPKVL